MKMLVVDDDPDTRQILISILAQRSLVPVEFAQARDGWDGMRVANQVRPDIVLVDMFMPGMDGFSMVRELRSHPWGRDIRIVVISAGSFDDRLKEYGIEYLAKPITLRQLLEFARRVSEERMANPFIQAVMEQDLASVRQLALARAGGLESFDKMGFTPLMHAAQRGDLAMAEFILTHSKEPQQKNSRGQNALTSAIQGGGVGDRETPPITD